MPTISALDHPISMDARAAISTFLATGNRAAAAEAARQELHWRNRHGFDTRFIARVLVRIER
jgi:hypothetical protein